MRAIGRPQRAAVATGVALVAILAAVIAIAVLGGRPGETDGLGAVSYQGPRDLHAVGRLDDRLIVAGSTLGSRRARAVVGWRIDASNDWPFVLLDVPPIRLLGARGSTVWGATDCYEDSRNCLVASDDGGAAWRTVESEPVDDLAVIDARHVVVIAHRPRFLPTIKETSDGGRTWTSLADPCGQPQMVAVALGVVEGRLAYVACSRWSADAGWAEEGGWKLLARDPVRGWEVRSSAGGHDALAELDQYDPQDLAFSGPAVGFMTLDSHPYRTSDGGRTWASAPISNTAIRYGGASSIAVSDDNVAFAVVRTEGAGTEVVTSNDGGHSWLSLAAWPWVW